MVKAYLRYETAPVFGTVFSPGSQVSLSSTGRTVFSGANEELLAWSVSTGELSYRLRPDGSDAPAVTRVAHHPPPQGGAGATCAPRDNAAPAHSGSVLVTGHGDGSIRLWSPATRKEKAVLRGHPTAVTALTVSIDGLVLASGGADCTVVLWDLATEVGMYRLRGHSQPVSAIAFGSGTGGEGKKSRLITTSLDGNVRLWCLLTKSCLQTVTGHGGSGARITSLAVCPGGLVLTGSDDTSLTVWDATSVPAVEVSNGSGDQSQYEAPNKDSSSKASRNADKSDEKEEEEEDEEGKGKKKKEGISELDRLVSEVTSGDVGLTHRGLATLGGLPRHSPERVVAIECRGDALAVLTADRFVQVWRIRSEDEIAKKIAKRLKRKRKRGDDRDDKDAIHDDDEDDVADDGAGSSAEPTPKKSGKKGKKEGKEKKKADKTPSSKSDKSSKPSKSSKSKSSKSDAGTAAGATVAAEELYPSFIDRDEVPMPSDIFEPVILIRASHARVRSISLGPRTASGASGSVTIAMGLGNNSIETHKVDFGSKTSIKMIEVTQPGHRSDVRALALSPDDHVLASTSSTELKLWNTRTLQCVRTVESGYGLCVSFAPGGAHVVVGTKDGLVHLIDASSAEIVWTGDEHERKAVWGVAQRPDRNGFATAGADKRVRLWDYVAEVSKATGETVSVTARCTESFAVDDEALGVAYSPDGRLLAVSLLDATVRVFFADTHRFFLSLYGHRLPVLSFDISSDSTLLATGSADKNLKIWGLDYGDCHRSLLAHDDAVTQVRFVRSTHMLVTTGKDGTCAVWDCDAETMVQRLPGSRNSPEPQLWSLAISRDGSFCAAAGADRAIRIVRRSDEQMFLEEEREREWEEREEKEALAGARDALGAAPGAVGAAEAEAPTTKTVETLRAADRLIEAIDLVKDELERVATHDRETAAFKAGETRKPPAPLPPNVYMMSCPGGAYEYLFRAVSKIRGAELDDCLLTVPFDAAVLMLRASRVWLAEGRDVELCARVAMRLVRAFRNQLIAAREMPHDELGALGEELRGALQRRKDLLGDNIGGFNHVRRDLQIRQQSML